MPRKKLPMRKINEILRLRAQGMSVADIATSTGAGRTTVYEYLARAESAGMGGRARRMEGFEAVHAGPEGG